MVCSLLSVTAIGLLLQLGFGLDKSTGILLGATIVLGYTMVGGQFSAITSQWLQALLQGLGMLLFLVFAVSIHGGISEAGLSITAWFKRPSLPSWLGCLRTPTRGKSCHHSINWYGLFCQLN